MSLGFHPAHMEGKERNGTDDTQLSRMLGRVTDTASMYSGIFHCAETLRPSRGSPITGESIRVRRL